MRCLRRAGEGVGSPRVEVVDRMKQSKSGPLEEQKLLLIAAKSLQLFCFLMTFVHAFCVCICVDMHSRVCMWESLDTHGRRLCPLPGAAGVVIRSSGYGGRRLAEPSQRPMYCLKT